MLAVPGDAAELVFVSAWRSERDMRAHFASAAYGSYVTAVTDLLAGQTNMMFDNIPSSLPHIKSGKLIALATTGAKRDPALPDLPTMQEAGVQGYESGVWFGLMVPAATPADIQKRVNAAAVAALKSAAVTEQYAKVGGVASPGTPQEYAAFLASEQAKWNKVVTAIGFKEGS